MLRLGNLNQNVECSSEPCCYPAIEIGLKDVSSEYLLAILMCSGCSLLFNEAPSDPISDCGIEPGPDASPYCSLSSCPSQTIVHSIGSNPLDDFASPQDWIDARHGDLVTRVVIGTDTSPNGYAPGESVEVLVDGEEPECSGIFGTCA